MFLRKTHRIKHTCRSFRWIGPLIMGLGYFYLSRQADLRLAFPQLVLTSALEVAILGAIWYGLSKKYFGLTALEVIFWAFIFRVFFVSDIPQLSDDLYRYLWDGARVAAGENPYDLPPAAFVDSVKGPMAEILARTNHPHLVTIYPPGAQVLFALAWKLFPGLVGLKSLLTLLDLVTCFFLTKLAPRPGVAIAYAWHPLAVLEVSSSGHLEAALGLFVILTLYFLKRKQFFRAGLCEGMAIMVKIVPLIFLPFFLKAPKRLFNSGLSPKAGLPQVAFGAGVGLIIFLLLLPFLGHLSHLFGTLKIYTLQWEFSGFLYEILKALWGKTEARVVLLLSFLSLGFLIYQKNFPLEKSLYLVALAFLLTTPTLHPWYVLLFLIFLPLNFRPEGLLLGWVAFLPYYVLRDYALFGLWQENHFMTAILFVVSLICFLSGFKYSGRKKAKGETP